MSLVRWPRAGALAARAVDRPRLVLQSEDCSQLAQERVGLPSPYRLAPVDLGGHSGAARCHYVTVRAPRPASLELLSQPALARVHSRTLPMDHSTGPSGQVRSVRAPHSLLEARPLRLVGRWCRCLLPAKIRRPKQRPRPARPHFRHQRRSRPKPASSWRIDWRPVPRETPGPWSVRPGHPRALAPTFSAH